MYLKTSYLNFISYKVSVSYLHSSNLQLKIEAIRYTLLPQNRWWPCTALYMVMRTASPVIKNYEVVWLDTFYPFTNAFTVDYYLSIVLLWDSSVHSKYTNPLLQKQISFMCWRGQVDTGKTWCRPYFWISNMCLCMDHYHITYLGDWTFCPCSHNTYFPWQCLW